MQALDKAAAAARSNVTAAEANLARLNQSRPTRPCARPSTASSRCATWTPARWSTKAARCSSASRRPDRLRTYINLPQSRSGLREAWASTAIVTIAELPGRKFTGTVTRTANALDPATRTLLTEVQVANPGGVLMPGMYAQVDLTVPRKDPPLLIPGDTLVVRSDGPQVAVVAAGWHRAFHAHPAGPRFRRPHRSALRPRGGPAARRQSERRGPRRREGQSGGRSGKGSPAKKQ